MKPNKPIRLFYSYSHKDEEFRNELENHLSILKRQGVISQWHDRKIEAGDNWAEAIDTNLDQADVILLLVSADFLASDYCYSKEMNRALERHKKGGAAVIPVILRSVDWQGAPFSHLQALPKDAKPVTLWANRDEAYTNVARGIRLLCQRLQGTAIAMPEFSLPDIQILCEDATEVECDVLILKYAQENYGVDAVVSELLLESGVPSRKIKPLPGKYGLVGSNSTITPTSVLFVGVLPLHRFDYAQIREFGNYSLQILTRERASAKHACLTMHGAGYGLDEKESFLALLAGLYEGLNQGAFPRSLARISIVERNAGRAQRLAKLLKEFESKMRLAAETMAKQESFARWTHDDYKLNSRNRPSSTSVFEQQFDAGLNSGSKQHVFVAMPFAPEMEDVFIFGIQGPVQAAGYLCERIDYSSFTGDVLARIKSRIESASLVIADLSGANPNVYLEVGYAWGKNKPTLLLSNNSDTLKFDIKSHRCIVYKSIHELAKRLQTDLEATPSLFGP